MAKRKVVSEFDKWFFAQFPQYKLVSKADREMLLTESIAAKSREATARMALSHYDKFFTAYDACLKAWQAREKT